MYSIKALLFLYGFIGFVALQSSCVTRKRKNIRNSIMNKSVYVAPKKNDTVDPYANLRRGVKNSSESKSIKKNNFKIWNRSKKVWEKKGLGKGK